MQRSTCNGSRAPENLFQLGLSYHAVQLFHAQWPTGGMETSDELPSGGMASEVGKEGEV